jgi:hypothetical protein
MIEADKKFVKKFKKWLVQFNTLYDVGYICQRTGNRKSLTDEELAWFRNNPTAPYREYYDLAVSVKPRKLFRHKPTIAAITNHIVQGGDLTLWVINTSDKDILLMLLDIDAKQNQRDAQQYAEFISTTYFDGQTFIEPSTSGNGRHMYFLMDVKFIKRSEIGAVMREFADFLRRETGKRFRSVIDPTGFFGVPTIWESSEVVSAAGSKKVYKVVRRGNWLKMPYLSNGEADLNRLCGLEAVSLEAIRANLSAVKNSSCTAPSLHQNNIGMTKGVTTDDIRLMSGPQRRCHAVDALLKLRKGKPPTAEETLDYYHEQYPYTGMSPKDVKKRFKDFLKLIPKRAASYDEKQVAPDFMQYVPTLKLAITPDQLTWGRREKLTYEKLSVYLIIKAGQCLTERPDEHFGRATDASVIKTTRTLKARGKIGFVLNKEMVRHFNKIAIKAGLLQLVADYVKPTFKTDTNFEMSWANRVKKINGSGKLLVPTALLDSAVHERFWASYAIWKTKQVQSRLG